jgi:high-affinity iron transporter
MKFCLAMCLLLILFLSLVLNGPVMAQAETPASPWQLAEHINQAMFQAQVALASGDEAKAQIALAAATQNATQLTLPAASQSALNDALAQAQVALSKGDSLGVAAAKGQITGILYRGSYHNLLTAIQAGDADLAQQWLLVRDYRPSTRFTRPGADATLALRAMAALATEEVLSRVQADLLDTYQARLTEQLALLSDASILPMRQAEAAGYAWAVWPVLQPAYQEQMGAAAAAHAATQFDSLLDTTRSGDSPQATAIQLTGVLNSFRAAPLTPDEQARRAGQLLRFLALVPVEYGRGVTDGVVMVPFELQEAVTFMKGAQTAFADLRLNLATLDPTTTAKINEQMAQVAAAIEAANRQEAIAPVAEIQTAIQTLNDALTQLFPAEWLTSNTDADFDVLAEVLDQMEAAAQQGDYVRAESARLEGYAIFDFGPEPRLLAFAPERVAQIDGLFWQGYDGQMGLAQVVALKQTPAEIAAVRAILDQALLQAQQTLGDLPSAPGAIIGNAAIIVFREGLESVVILAALMASLVGAYAHYRRPMVLGVLLSLVATALTWWLAQQVLTSLTRFGERLEAVVSLIAIGVLLLITNWFFHKTYWKDWMAGFHQQKRQLLSQEAGQFLGLMLLGFTSMYREGFETVLFLQALVLDAGASVVLQGVALGSVAVLLVGVLTFRLQKRLPYKTMLVWTGVLIGLVLITMVGKTVHVMQAVGWLSITPIHSLVLPYWAGLWLGLFATWQGIVGQIAAAVFVVGSYYLAEYWQARQRPASTATRT